MAIQYAPGVLQESADDLYRRAKEVAIITTLQYGLGIFLLSWLLLRVTAPALTQALAGVDATAVEIVAAVVGLVWGVTVGRRQAFAMRLHAQQILCQLQVELNTRAQAKSTGAVV